MTECKFAGTHFITNPVSMKKFFHLLIISIVVMNSPVFGWGRSGHDAIAYIAECHLTSKAKRQIEHYLDRRSIVYYASWMDRVRTTKNYKQTSQWHGNSVDELGYYQPDTVRGDAIYGINRAIEMLKDLHHSSDSTIRTAIFYLVHLVGDMHCPSHIRFPWYKSFKFEINGHKCSFHSFWDTDVLELSHRWGYEDYQYQLDRYSKKEIAQIALGSPSEWLHDSAQACRVLCDRISENDRLDKSQTNAFLLEAQQLAEEQILKAGYRLARILNDLFD